MTNSSVIYRAKALSAEKVAREASNYNLKTAWGDIAIEWHALANRAAREKTSDYIELA
jgi:hypothetical protein